MRPREVETCTRCGRRRNVRGGSRPKSDTCRDCTSIEVHEWRPDGDDRADLAEQMVPVACQLAMAVRDDPAEVEQILTDHAHVLSALAVVLAAMVPDDRTPDELLAWMEWNGEYQRLRDLGVRNEAAREVAKGAA